MMQETADRKWFDDLVLELRLRQVHGSAIGDAVASARELLGDTGQRAEDAFGPARDYAAALDLPAAPAHHWVRTALWPALLGLLAFLLFNQAVMAWVRSETMLISPAQLALLALPVVLIAFLPLYLTAVIRRLWVLACLAAVCAAAGLLSAIVAPTERADAWLAIEPLPWVVGTAVVMVALSVRNTVISRRPGQDDDIADPLAAAEATGGVGAKVGVVIANWLFPLFALAMLGLARTLS